MKVAVIGASGTMGSKIVKELEASGALVVPASKSTGVNVITREGLDSALVGVDTVVDVINSGSLGNSVALDFFQRATRNIVGAAKAASVKHYLTLSVMGTDRLVENDYFRGKLVQENIVRSCGLPYTVVRSAQFFDFIAGILGGFEADGALRLPEIDLQPLSADEAAKAIASLSVSSPRNTIVELAGPQSISLNDIANEYLTATSDGRSVLGDPLALYFGVGLPADALLPSCSAMLAELSFHDWLRREVLAAA